MQPQAFLSYTRVDDEFFGGAITSLRRLLELGVQVVTGDLSFKIFQDIEGIEFGQQWQKRLDQAIQAATFLIPILTPCFFRSDACRDELQKFLRHENLSGRDDLILPIYFVTVPALEKHELLHNDSLAVEISKRQRFDWRLHADLPITDPQIRSAVKNLSHKLAPALQRRYYETSPRRYYETSDFDQTDQIERGSQVISDEEKAKQTHIFNSQILWVDDRPDNNKYERSAMEAYGVKFTLARSTEEALQKIERNHFDVIISDMGRPPDRMAGYTLLGALRARGNDTPYLIYAGSRSPEHVAEALRLGAQGSTNVPDELIALVLASIKAQAGS